MSYHAFGERRQGDWRASDPLLPIIPALTNRGFTGHEHIDEMGFIHMNGRVYDPSIGRFLSADTYIQDPYNTQSYNRYSYVINNPLKYTDPSGNFFGIVLGLISAVATKAMIAAIGVELLLTKIAIAYAVSYTVTYAATGSAKAAQGAGLAAGLFMGIGGLRGEKMGVDGKMQHNPGWESGSMKTLAAHGLAGGIVQDRMGGSFGAGFLAGSVGSYLGSSGNAANTSELVTNTITDAVVGGTVSVIGGGKFANGAQTGAFRYLFNESMHSGSISKHTMYENKHASFREERINGKWKDIAFDQIPSNARKALKITAMLRPSAGYRDYEINYYYQYEERQYNVYGYYSNDIFVPTTARFNIEPTGRTSEVIYFNGKGKDLRVCLSFLCTSY
ncbi:Rhs family protein [Bathymodiolus heckerae thiotrophic gill symbiont]|nr:Rhs family protein [Bathymodiolus heckerae thiotrophic gill symbiont]